MNFHNENELPILYYIIGNNNNKGFLKKGIIENIIMTYEFEFIQILKKTHFGRIKNYG